MQSAYDEIDGRYIVDGRREVLVRAARVLAERCGDGDVVTPILNALTASVCVREDRLGIHVSELGVVTVKVVAPKPASYTFKPTVNPFEQVPFMASGTYLGKDYDWDFYRTGSSGC